MKLTNKYDLPDVFCEAVEAFDSDYDAGESDYTATGLIQPVRIASLLAKHKHQITEDVSERVWALAGHMGHILWQRLAERHPLRYIAEKRFFAEVNDFKVSARVDCYDKEEQTVWDYKESSVWKFIIGDTREWEQQLNINAFCLTENGIYPEYLNILVKLKDWKLKEAENGRDDYPKTAIHVVHIPMWSPEEQRKFIEQRISDHETGYVDPPVCTMEERWEKETKYALMQKGKKRAVKLFPTFNEAFEASQKWDRNTYFVETRGGEATRCLYYCPVNKFCSFYKQLKGIK